MRESERILKMAEERHKRLEKMACNVLGFNFEVADDKRKKAIERLKVIKEEMRHNRATCVNDGLAKDPSVTEWAIEELASVMLDILERGEKHDQ